MNILSAYIARNVVLGWLAVTLVLTAVFGLILFIQEIERTAQSYQIAQVAQYVLMIMPQQIINLAPVIALLGTIMALASLDRFNELTIISCAGVPLRRLMTAVAVPTLLLVIFLWVSMEYLAAPLNQQAEQLRFSARNNNSVELPAGGVWSSHNGRYMNLQRMLADGNPGKIRLYEFDENGLLLRFVRAKTAIVEHDRSWSFRNVRQKRIISGRMHTTHPKELEIENLWSRKELPTLTTSSENMSLSVLYSYSQYMKQNNQPSIRYEMAFWQKLTLPLSVAAMVLLATPISASLGSRRSRNFGTNMGIGAAIGISFYLLAQITYSLGQLLGLPLLLVCLLPTAAIGLIALWLLTRMRW